MLIEQIIEFETKVHGPSGRSLLVLLKLVIFIVKQILHGKSSRQSLFTVKNISLGNVYLAFFYLGRVTYNIQPKMQDFKRILDLTCK